MSVAAAGPLLALALTGSPIAAGYVTAASVLPGLLLHVPAGLLVDRFDRPKVMWASQVVRIVSAVAACLCLIWQCDSVSVLVVAALIDGSCAVFYEVAEIATVPDLVSKKSLNLAIGSNEAKLNASMLLGRPLGGVLLAVHPTLPWIATVCTSLFSVFALIKMGRWRDRIRSQGHHADAPTAPADGERVAAGDARPQAVNQPFRSVLDQLLRDSFSRAVLVVCVLANFFFQVIVLLQILLAEQKGLPSYIVGLLLAWSGLGGFVGAVGSPWFLRRRPPSASVMLCVLAWVPMVWIAAAWRNPVVGLAMWGLCSVIGAHINVALRTYQAKKFPSELLGRITGITRFLSVGAVALGAFSGGWIISALGTRGTAVLVGVAFTAIAVILVAVLNFISVQRFIHAALQIMRRTALEVRQAWRAVPGCPEE